MVRTSEQSNAPPTAAAIVGGFVSIPVSHLLAVWFACQGLELGVGEFRAWLACIEMVKRRAFARDDFQPTYGFAELARLLDVSQQRARLLVQNLVAAGLLTWSDSAITFPKPPPVPDDLFAPFADTIGRGQGSLVIPRTLLRFLVRGATNAIIAVALGALLRCLSCRKGHPDSWGRFKSCWIAQAFRVGLRQVKQARNKLVELGWLIVEGNNRQHAMNRHGRAYRINLHWSPNTARSAPPPPAPAAHSAPPLKHQNPLREEGFKNQNPASGELAGICARLARIEAGIPTTPLVIVVSPPLTTESFTFVATTLTTDPERPDTAHPAAIPVSTSSREAAAQGTTPASLPTPTRATTPTSTRTPFPPALGSSRAEGEVSAPRLADVTIEDLKDTARLLVLLGQAIERKLVGSSERDRLNFVALAEHALAIGKGNPPGLFAHLLRGGCWRYITQEDEDRARVRLKAHDRGPESVSGRSTPTAAPGRRSSFVADDPRGDKPSSLSGLLGRLGMVDASGAVVGGVTAMGQEPGPRPMAEEATSKPAGEKPIGLNWRDYVPPVSEVSPPKPATEKPGAEKPCRRKWLDYVPKELGGRA